jgi:hypothetical protein
MNRRDFICIATAVAGTLAARPTLAAVEKPGDLEKVRSRNLDELLKRPKTDFGTFRRVRLDAIGAQADPAWLKSMNYNRKGGPKLTEADARKLAEVAAASLTVAIARAFTDKGLEVVKDSGPGGVLDIKASATNLFLNAPELYDAGAQSVAEEVGKATLQLEARDAASGALLLKTTHKGTARTVARAARATNVSNRFYFDALFTEWAAHVVQEMK